MAKIEHMTTYSVRFVRSVYEEWVEKDMNVVLILSGGTGTRMGLDVPKQYLEVGGRRILEYSLLPFKECGGIDAVQIVADIKWRETIEECLAHAGFMGKFRGLSVPGANRQLSILSGLEDISQYASPDCAVIVHDAARPRVSSTLIKRSLAALPGHDGVLPVLPMKDTVYYSGTGQRIDRLLQRECVYAGQAPETFRLGSYLAANRALLPDKILEINGSTEPAVMAGLDIVLIPGEEQNYKITTRADMQRLEQELR